MAPVGLGAQRETPTLVPLRLGGLQHSAGPQATKRPRPARHFEQDAAVGRLCQLPRIG